MSNVNVINNTGSKFNVTVNGDENKIEIVIDLANKDFKLPKSLKSGDVFKDIDGDEYILLNYLENGDAEILRKDNLTKIKFGSNNNYNGSDIDKYMCNTYLPELERKFGKENIVEHDIDLLSLDGEDDYGIIKRKVSIPTLDCYRVNKKKIKKHIKNWFWISTPNSVPSGCGSDGVVYVDSFGCVDYGWCDGVGGVRPRFVLNSSIFES